MGLLRVYCRAVTPLLDGSPVGLLISGAIVAMILGLGLLMLAPTIKARSPTIPIAGLLLVSPVAVVVIDGARWSTEALIGLAVLVGTGLVVPEHYPPFVKGAASIPGAAVLSIGTDNRTAVFLLVGIPVLSTAVARFEDGHDYEHGLSAMCAAIAGGGVFLTVPDTENTALLAGAGIVVGLLVLAEPRLTLGWSRYTWAGAFFLALAVDGAPRTTATIGGIAALGLILIDPVVRAITKVGRGLLAPRLRGHLQEPHRSFR